MTANGAATNWKRWRRHNTSQRRLLGPPLCVIMALVGLSLLEDTAFLTTSRGIIKRNGIGAEATPAADDEPAACAATWDDDTKPNTACHSQDDANSDGAKTTDQTKEASSSSSSSSDSTTTATTRTRATRLRVATGNGETKERVFAGIPATNIAEVSERKRRPATLGEWVDVKLAEGVTAVKGYTAPQVAHDATLKQTALQGWMRIDKSMEQGDELFAIPEALSAARPYRPELWKVSMKGVERAFVLGKDGVARLSLALDRGTWVPLVGFGYNTASASS